MRTFLIRFSYGLFLSFVSVYSLKNSHKINIFETIKHRSLQTFSKSLKTQDPEVLATGVVYFVQGSLAVSRIATSFFLKDELSLSPVEISYLTGITSFPWALKPVYGLISDNIPILGSRRRSYLIISSLLGIISWVALSLFVSSPSEAATAIFLSSLSVAVSDVVIDSIVVEKTQMQGSGVDDERIKSAADYQTICWGASSAGALVSTLLGVNALSLFEPREIFLFTAILPLAVAISALFINEKVVKNFSDFDAWEMILMKMRDIFQFLKSQKILFPLLFLILWRITPNSESAIFYFYTNQLAFSESFISKLQFLTSLSSLFGILIYRNFISKRLKISTLNDEKTKSNGEITIASLIKSLLLLSVPFNLLQIFLTSGWNRNYLHLSNELFSAIDATVISFFEEVSFMPIMTLATVLCPQGAEGAIFASIMAVFNLAGIFSNEISAVLMKLFHITDHNFENLSLYVAICGLSSLLPIAFADILLSKLGKAKSNE